MQNAANLGDSWTLYAELTIDKNSLNDLYCYLIRELGIKTSGITS